MKFRLCEHIMSNGERCRLPYSHATDHQWRPTVFEWVAGLVLWGREGVNSRRHWWWP